MTQPIFMIEKYKAMKQQDEWKKTTTKLRWQNIDDYVENLFSLGNKCIK